MDPNTRENHQEVNLEQVSETFAIHADEVKNNYKKMTAPQICQLFCHTHNQDMFINFHLIKYMFLDQRNKDTVINIIRNNLMAIQERGYPTITIHISLKLLSITQLDTYFMVFKEASEVFKQEFPNVLEKCYLYHCSTLVTYLFRMIRTCLEKETIQKITLYKKIET